VGSKIDQTCAKSMKTSSFLKKVGLVVFIV
jgi:hypothetical protein